MKSITIVIGALLTLAFTGKDKLTGRWQTKPSDKGNVTTAIFREDQTFEGFVNKKPFVSGKYQLKADTLAFTDNGCNGLEGQFKMIFFSNNDSLRFETISDPCEQRRQGMERLVLGRAQEYKP